MSEEARREAVKRYKDGTPLPGLAYPAEALREYRRGGFVAGAEWQAARDRERIEALEAEVERYRLAHDIVYASTATAEEIGQSVSTVAQVIARTDAIAWREQGRELDAEVERLRGQLDAADRQIEARTGETAGERLWKARAEQADAERAAAIELMQEAESDTERAEATLARIREVVTERIDGYPDDPYDFVREFALGVLEIMDGDANADDS